MCALESRTGSTILATSSLRYRWLLAAVAGLVGCERLFLPKPPETVEGSYLVHIVSASEAREDIDTIVLWYTGSEDNVPAIRLANPHADLSALKPGQRVVIPSNLVTQTNAMPRRRFTLGVDVPPPAPVSDSPEATPPGKRGDPLEELMRKQERRLTPRPTPSQVETPAGALPVPSSPVVNVEPENPSPSTQAGNSKRAGSPRVESFSDDEIGDLSSASEVPSPPSAENATARSPARDTAQTKNPRSRRAPQPEVFEEE